MGQKKYIYYPLLRPVKAVAKKLCRQAGNLLPGTFRQSVAIKGAGLVAGRICPLRKLNFLLK